MKHVLIVSPRFPPINAADHQRVRMALPYFKEFGWKVTVLCVDPEFVEASDDKLLERSIPEDIRVIKAKAMPFQLTRKFGIGSLSIRSKKGLDRAGQALLKKDDVDLVFFSTTEFGILPLGLKWKNKFGIPFVLDIQDPWVNDHYRKTGQRPPGGQFKHRVTQWFSSRQEGKVVSAAAHTMVVSDQYTTNLLLKYPNLDEKRFDTVPFSATPFDFELVEREQVTQTEFDPNDKFRHWVYVGRCGPDMKYSLTAMLTAFKNALSIDSSLKNVRMHFLGTDYANQKQARHWVTPIAESLGITEFVSEKPNRIPYFSTLRCLQQADALIVPGSDDPRYTASKLYPYILAKRPLLTVFHSQSSVNKIMRSTNAGVPVCFESEDSVETLAVRIQSRWFENRIYEKPAATSWKEFEPYTAHSMTKRITQVFDNVLASREF